MFLVENPTKQQVFDHVLHSLRLQKEPALARIGYPPDPSYRGKDGTKCAIGHWISDDVYSASMENLTIVQLYSKGFLKGSLAWMADPQMMPLLELLQDAHDDTFLQHGLSKWEERMKLIAEIEELNYQ